MTDWNDEETEEDGIRAEIRRRAKVLQLSKGPGAQIKDLSPHHQQMLKEMEDRAFSKKVTAGDSLNLQSAAPPLPSIQEMVTSASAPELKRDDVSASSKGDVPTGGQATVRTKSEYSGTSMEEMVHRLEAMGFGNDQYTLALKHALASSKRNSPAVVTGVTQGTWSRPPIEREKPKDE
jgi:hypothetical protein